MVTQFNEYLVKGNLTKNTIRSYEWTVKYFMEHYKVVNKRNLLAYKGHLVENFKPQTVNLRLQAINKYLDHLVSRLPPLTKRPVQPRFHCGCVSRET